MSQSTEEDQSSIVSYSLNLLYLTDRGLVGRRLNAFSKVISLKLER